MLGIVVLHCEKPTNKDNKRLHQDIVCAYR